MTPLNLWRGAKAAAADSLHSAVGIVDSEFGQGYATDHPQLVVATMEAMSRDFDSMMCYYFGTGTGTGAGKPRITTDPTDADADDGLVGPGGSA